jgi:hypothetical protein
VSSIPAPLLANSNRGALPASLLRLGRSWRLSPTTMPSSPRARTSVCGPPLFSAASSKPWLL